MEPISESLVERLLRAHAKPGAALVDVGSYDVNGTVRPIAARCGITDYTGLDMREGPNVDHVIPERGAWELGRKWPVVVTANTLEHTRRPWEFFAQCVSLLEPGGLLIVVAPWSWKIHPHPIDCWRVLPDGLRTLYEDFGFEVLACDVQERLCFGAGRRNQLAANVDPLSEQIQRSIERVRAINEAEEAKHRALMEEVKQTQSQLEALMAARNVSAASNAVLSDAAETDAEAVRGVCSRALEDLMSAISEDRYAAGWMQDLEYDLWEAAHGRTERYRLCDTEKTSLLTLSRLAGGWYDRRKFVPLAEWLEIVEKRAAR